MNVQETTDIRELVPTELDEVSGGLTFGEWLYGFACGLLAVTLLETRED
jgi:hypothetical protein